MITIIICSINPLLRKNIKQNIANTIGDIEYELFIHENEKDASPITKVYNDYRRKSKYPIAIYMHEDCQFLTENWGKKIIDYFEDRSIGIVGFAGSTLKLKSPSYWNSVGKEYQIVNVQQKKNNQIIDYVIGFPENQNLVQVATLDGLFLATRKVDNIWFNEIITGFHAYDTSISIEYHINGFKNMVNNEIKLIHFSEGSFNSQWLNGLFQISTIYKHVLPINLNSSSKIVVQEDQNLKNIFHKLCDKNMTTKAIQILFRIKNAGFKFYIVSVYRILRTKLFPF